MAAVQSKLEDLNEAITCPICHEHFQEPKILPCLHYYCKECIRQLAARKRPFPCPECRQDTLLPQNDPDRLPNAFFVNRMKEVYGHVEKTHGKVKAACEMCSESKAVAFCRQCTYFICSKCVESHETLKVFHGHEVVALEDPHVKQGGAKEIRLKEGPTMMCPEHEEQMKMFCFNCNRLICRDCILLDHSDHKYAFVRKSAPQCKEKLMESLTALRKIQDNFRAATKEVEAVEKEVSDQHTAISKTINRSFEQLFEILKQRKKQLLRKASEMTQEKLGALTVQKKSFQMALVESQSLSEFVERSLDIATNEELMSLHQQILTRVQEGCRKYKQVDLEPATVPNIAVKVPTDCIPATLGKIYHLAADPMKCTADDPNTAPFSIEIPRCPYTGMELSTVCHHSNSPAIVPFVDQLNVLKCDSRGKEFTNSDHDITLRVPEGAIPDGVTVHIEAGVALHGPFQFPPGTTPISPIVWFCMQEGILLQKPVEVILPHFLHNWEGLQLGFLKADHSTHTSDDGEERYMFQKLNDPMEFYFTNGRSFGVLSTKHFCSLCIQSNITRDQLPSKAQYCLTEVIPEPWPSMPINVPLHFCVTFFLKTCFQMLEKQFPSNVKILQSPFTFQTTKLDHSETKLQIDVDEPQSGWIVALKRKEIRASAIDYWGRPELQLMEERDIYPPRFTVETCGTMATWNSVVRLRFKGSQEDLSTEILLPLYYHQPSVSPTQSPSAISKSSFSSSVGGGYAPSGSWNERDCHLEDQRPKLPALLKFLTDKGNISIPQRIGSIHADFGTFLLNDETGAIVDGISQEHRGNTDNINKEILKKWLQGRGRQPVTWRTLIEVLHDSQLYELADEIQKNLSRLT